VVGGEVVCSGRCEVVESNWESGGGGEEGGVLLCTSAASTRLSIGGCYITLPTQCETTADR
jgi:hypothetical protein